MDIVNLTKHYGKLTALDAISVKDIKGVHGLVGENGAGKTTLMRIIATVLEQDSGEVVHENLSWDDKDKVRKIIGYLPQKFGMYNKLTVREVLEHMAILKDISGDIRSETDKAIKLVNLEDKADSKVGTLSGGMVRRLGIAQAILGNPKILIVDEPTSGLDPEERMRFRLLLRDIGMDRIVLFSTHIIDDVGDICDKVTVLHKGHVMMTGTCGEIIENAKGKIWEVTIPETNIGALLKASVMTDRRRIGNQFVVRLISDKIPCNDAVPAEPSIEEGYLYLIHYGGMYA